jgi:hypothetical protein
VCGTYALTVKRNIERLGRQAVRAACELITSPVRETRGASLRPPRIGSGAPWSASPGELTAWMQLLAFAQHEARRWEPKRLRYRIFSAAAQLAHTGRRHLLHLAARSPWTQLIPNAINRLRALAVAG